MDRDISRAITCAVEAWERNLSHPRPGAGGTSDETADPRVHETSVIARGPLTVRTEQAWNLSNSSRKGARKSFRCSIDAR
mmetsp:Transcript_8098/g.50106  ORF Transcript_8098/g.50106 Transcript_8098/m.50106 type:complete len:80 (+) Transcript_8098:2029-2268(+)